MSESPMIRSPFESYRLLISLMCSVPLLYVIGIGIVFGLSPKPRATSMPMAVPFATLFFGFFLGMAVCAMFAWLIAA
jgi:hypothetical protein